MPKMAMKFTTDFAKPIQRLAKMVRRIFLTSGPINDNDARHVPRRASR
jgi:hypothetical protein